MRTALLATLLLVVPATAGAAPKSLCGPNETAAFSCPVGAKSVAICIAKSATPATAGLAYVYGTPAKVELRLPATGRAGVTRGTVAYSGGGADYVRFRNRTYAYVVYSGIGKGWEQDGVAIEKDGKLVSSLVCKTPGTGADGFAPIYAAKLPADPGQFEVPVR